MREWIWTNCGIVTPYQRGLPDSPPGTASTIQPFPTKDACNQGIQTAVSKANEYIGVSDSINIRTHDIEAQTANGPYIIDLAQMPGFPERAINSIRRAWWDDGSGDPVRLYPVMLTSLDRVSDNYLAYSPGVPYRFAIEGYRFYLMPANASSGTLQFMAGAGIGGPIDDLDSFDQVPADYDICLLYMALVQICKMYPNDVEMSRRVEMFTPDATAGLERLSAWFNGGNSDEVSPSLIYDARWMRRNRRRR